MKRNYVEQLGNMAWRDICRLMMGMTANVAWHEGISVLEDLLYTGYKAVDGYDNQCHMAWRNICTGKDWLYTGYKDVDGHVNQCHMAWTLRRRCPHFFQHFLYFTPLRAYSSLVNNNGVAPFNSILLLPCMLLKDDILLIHAQVLVLQLIFCQSAHLPSLLSSQAKKKSIQSYQLAYMYNRNNSYKQ